MLTGIHRYFPNTMMVAMIVLGIALGRVSWTLVGVGGVLVTILIAVIQFVLKDTPIGTTQTPGLIEACSTLPLALPNSRYDMIPSFWMTLTTFFISYIMSNAVSVYSSKPIKQPNTAIAVQQRKGIGVISIVAVLIIGLLLIGVRAMSPCESWWGIIPSILLGGGAGYGWWALLKGQGNDIFQDIHGVMIGLQPGDLRMGPVACAPSKST